MERYYVVSPNVWNDGNYFELLNDMIEGHFVLMGWGDDGKKGKIFLELEEGDCVVVAKRDRWIWNYYFMGKIASIPGDTYKNANRRFLSDFINLQNMSLDFLDYWSTNGSKQITAISEIKAEKGNANLIRIIDDLFLQRNKEIKMEKYLNLLKNSKNLIFTGAPGTGKTYLASRIAEKIVSDSLKISVSPKSILEERLKNYVPDLSKRKEDEDCFNALQKEFPINGITNIAIDDYCIGTGEKGGFCWFLERYLSNQGLYFPSMRGSYVYGIYKKKDGSYAYKTGLTGTPKEVLKRVLNSIKYCLDNKNDTELLDSQKEILDPGFILKILNSYYPNEFIQINTKSHFQNIIKMFGLNCTSKDNIFELERCLFSYYETIKSSMNIDITPCEFMRVIYKNFNVKEGEVNNSSNIEISSNTIKKYIKFVQFHQSYDYTDFVEGLRPVSDEDNSNSIHFVLKDGTFKKFCKQAAEDPNRKYVFIIDEINRGEVSKIFGELFYSIDPGYRGKQDVLVSTQYQNLVKDDDVFKDGFYVPSNVYLIGTMNDIDRGVESIDFAFRRRFAWEEILAKDSQDEILDQIKAVPAKNISKEKLCNVMNALNDAIWKDRDNCIEGLSSSYHIGAAYFSKINDYAEADEPFTKLWDYNLKPLLREYLRGMDSSEETLEILHKAYNIEVSK